MYVSQETKRRCTFSVLENGPLNGALKFSVELKVMALSRKRRFLRDVMSADKQN